ncbi:MAG: hypothetical protein Q9182_006559 [Xanthomendoza sp. 2 TL-2023]
MTSENLALVLAQTESKRDIVNAAVCDALNSPAPDSSQMRSGRVYVGRLPNHSGPVFVRRRRKSFANPFGVPAITSIIASPERPPIDYQCTTTAVYQPPPPAYMMQAPTQYIQPPQYVPQPADTTTTTVTTTVEPQPQPSSSSKYSCASCGKFRSPSTLQVKNSMTLNENVGRRRSRRLATGGVIDLTRLRSGVVRRVRRSAEGIAVPGPQTTDEGKEGHLNQLLRPAQGFTSSGGPSSAEGLKSDDDNNIPALQRIREEYHSDVEIEDDDSLEPRGRSRSRSFSRQSLDGSHSYDEDEYVRISTTTARTRPLSLLDRLTGSRSRSSSRTWRARHGERSVNYEDERVEISIRSREPSPFRHDRHEHEYEERIEERSPWRPVDLKVEQWISGLQNVLFGYYEPILRNHFHGVAAALIEDPIIAQG